MSLELPPELESTVREYAEAEGVSINDLIARHFPPRMAKRDPVAHVKSLLAQWQQQDNTPTTLPAPNDGTLTPSEALFRKWDAEDALLTDEERQAQAEQWQQFQQGINAERAANGMRLIF